MAAQELYEKRSSDPLSSLKKELADELGKRQHSLLVVLDDIDRLSVDELRLVFRLVKANADLPRLIYLLVFDRIVVEKALELEGHCKGADYLEKVVQVRFDVPSVDRARLMEVLVARFNEILKDLPDELKFDEPRFVDLFFRHIHELFTNLRDVYRFFAGLEFHAGVFRSGSSFEVNIVDLFALEALRLFVPDVHTAIAGRKVLLTRGHLNPVSDRSSDEDKAAIKALIDLAPVEHRVAVEEVMKAVFPRTAWALGGTGYAEGFESQWTLERRACTDTHFDKYFSLALPRGEISQQELDEIVRVSGDRAALRKIFRALKDDGRLPRLLLRLEYEKHSVKPDNAAAFLAALMDECDDLPDSEEMFATGSDMHVVRIAYWMTREFDDPALAERVLLDVITATEAIYTPALFVALEKPKEGSTKEYLVPEERLPAFRDVCLARIISAAESGALIRHPRMHRILWEWLEWGNEEDVRAWCQEQLEDPMNALELLKRLVGVAKQQGWGSVYSRRIPMIRLSEIEKLVDVDELAAKVTSLPDSSIDDEGRVAIDALKKALKRRAEGKGDAPFGDDD